MCISDWIIGSNLFGGQAEPSPIAPGGRLIIAANGFAQTFDQGAKQKPVAAAVGHRVVPESYAKSEAGGLLLLYPPSGRKRRGDGMGESRDAVKAASEIGRDHDGKVCPEQAIDLSVIAVTFRGATPRVVIEGGCAIGSP